MHCTALYWAVLYWLLATLYRMRTMKESLLTEFESFCDVEKFKLYILCGETRNYIRLGTMFYHHLHQMFKTIHEHHKIMDY